MATFRKVHISFWADPFVQDLTPEQKYFYLYLMTNGNTRQCGIYEITKKQICYDTGYNTDTVSKLLRYFMSHGKIMYSEVTNELALKNWPKYNSSKSPQVQSLVNEELATVKDSVLIEYVYSMDTQSHIRIEEEEEKEEEKEIEGAKQVRRNFTPPNQVEITEYLISEKEFDVPEAGRFAVKFWNFYDSKGWMVGKNKMKNWKSAVATWLQSPEWKPKTETSKVDRWR